MDSQGLDALHGAALRISTAATFQEQVDRLADAFVKIAGFGVCAISVRRSDDLLQAVSVVGDEDARKQVLGSHVPSWKLDEQIDGAEQWGVWTYVPHTAGASYGEYDYIPPTPTSDDPDAWHPLDALFCLLHGPDGTTIGLISVDLPPGGKRPDLDTVRLLDVLAVHGREILRRERERSLAETSLALTTLTLTVNKIAGQADSAPLMLKEVAVQLIANLDARSCVTRIDGSGSSWSGAKLTIDHEAQVQLEEAIESISRRALKSGRCVSINAGLPNPGAYAGMDAALRPFVEAKTPQLLIAGIGASGDWVGSLVLARSVEAPSWTEAEAAAVHSIGRDLGSAMLRLRWLDSERNHAERIREVDEHRRTTIRAISHAFRGPLASISGHAELLADPDDDRELIDISVSSIRRNADRLNHMLEDLLLLLKTEDPLTNVVEDVDLWADVMEAVDVWRMKAETLGVGFELHPPPAPVTVRGRRADINRLIDNLVSNAVKYCEADDTVSLSVTGNGSEATFVCADTGIGIPEGDRSRLFQEFFRGNSSSVRQMSGTGLGLFIVKQIADSHNGRIEVQSTPGEGTTFTLTLPRETNNQS